MFNLFSKCLEKPNSDGLYLPSEIWSHIFSFLRVIDRKNVRLTCSQWYDACNTIQLVRTERIIITSQHNDGTKLWFDVLMDCPRPRFSVKFVSLRQYPPDATVFWQKLGSRIESLSLIASINEKEFGGQMMKCCNNLETLYINERDYITPTNDCILNWNEPTVVHESLKCLVLKNCTFFTDFHFSRLFDIYPCIQKLMLICTQVNCHERVDARFYKNTSKFNSDSIFSFSCVFANIKSKAENITALFFDKIGSRGLPDYWFEKLASLPGLKLKELTLNKHPLLTEKAFIKFFANQTRLEHIKIKKCQNFSLKCLLHMIRNCSSMKYISVECLDVSPNFLMSKEIFHTLMLLPFLKNLKLKGMIFMEENVNVSRVAPVNASAFQHLYGLSLKMPSIYFDIFFPKILSNLSFLHLAPLTFGEKGLTDVNLQLIFDKLIQLRFVLLGLDSTVSDFGFTGCRVKSENQRENSGISIKRLKRLEKLILICNSSVENSMTYASFSHFVFPNLRELKLIRFRKITEKIFNLLRQNTPSMELCIFEKCEIENEALMKFQEGWKFLDYFQDEKTIRQKVLKESENFLNSPFSNKKHWAQPTVPYSFRNTVVLVGSVLHFLFGNAHSSLKK